MAPSSSVQDTLARLGPPSLVVVVALLFANNFLRPSYDSARPAGTPLTSEEDAPPDQVRALLTHDPLELADRVRRKSAVGAPPSAPSTDSAVSTDDDSPERSRQAQFEYGDGARLLLLGVCVQGGGRPEDREFRTRARYATVRALDLANVLPDDANHLLVARVRWNGRDLLVPYERYSPAVQPGPKDKGWSRVLVFWLDEQAAGDGLYSCAQSIVRQLCFPSQVLDDATVAIVGPTTTDGLTKLLKDAERPQEAWDAGGSKPSVKFRSPAATAPIEGELMSRLRIEMFGSDHASIKRTIRKDAELARLLVFELSARLRDLMALDESTAAAREAWSENPWWIRHGLTLLQSMDWVRAPERVRIAIVAEQDTGYGRNWSDELRRAWNAFAKARGLDPERVEFELFGFLRGIDGLELSSGTSKASDAQTKHDIDYPVGASQIDYVSRLERQFTQGRGFDAVGVFGSDVYDKLMILQALRPIARGAVFFTTDLDARFSHPKHLPYTRNLVVASFFPLVSDESEGSAVPAETRNGLAFRDTYQLSVFRTVQDVLTGVDRPIPTPVVHEIGVNGPVALRMDCEHDHSEGDPDGEGEESESDRGYSTSIARSRLFAAIDAFVPDVLDGLPRSLEPKVVAAATAPRTTSAQNEESLRSPVSAPGQGKLATLRLVGSIVLLAILLALLSKRPRGLETELVRVLRLGAGRRLVLPLLVVVAVLFLMNEISHGFGLPYPEPLELLSGASAWLSVILRVIVLVYCAWAILAIRASLAGLHDDVEEKWELKPKRPSAQLPSWWLRIVGLNDVWAAVVDGFKTSAAAIPRGCRNLLVKLRALVRCDGVPAVIESSPKVALADAWRRARPWMSSRALLVPRLMIYAYVCFWLVKPFFRITHNPPPPIRGEFTFVLERLTLFTHIWAFYMLVCYVLEVSFASTWLVAKIADPGAIAMPDVKPRANHDEPVVVTEYRVRLRLAEQITRTIERLVWFPVIAVSLMILARASAIDAWGWSPVLVGNFVGYFVLIVACVLNVHAVANAAKHRALAVIREERRRATPETPTAKSIDRTVEELESLRGGAFSPLWEHPLVRSAALPLLTLASTLFIDLGMLRRMLGF